MSLYRHARAVQGGENKWPDRGDVPILPSGKGPPLTSARVVYELEKTKAWKRIRLQLPTKMHKDTDSQNQLLVPYKFDTVNSGIYVSIDLPFSN